MICFICLIVCLCVDLQVNVYKLGAVYLQLTKLLRIEDHPSLTRPIDPSLYLVRFVKKLGVKIPGEASQDASVGEIVRQRLLRFVLVDCWRIL